MSGALSAEENAEAKVVLDRFVAMLTRLGRRGYAVGEEPAEDAAVGVDPDADGDSDLLQGNVSQPWPALSALSVTVRAVLASAVLAFVARAAVVRIPHVWRAA